MGNGPSKPQSQAGTEERIELTVLELRLEALAPNPQIDQWSSDVKTGRQLGRIHLRCGDSAARFLQGSVGRVRAGSQTGSTASVAWLITPIAAQTPGNSTVTSPLCFFFFF